MQQNIKYFYKEEASEASGSGFTASQNNKIGKIVDNILYN